MNLFTKIRDLRTESLKSGDKFNYQVLTNIFSDAERVGKDAGQRMPDDHEVIAVIKAHLKGVNEFIKVLKNSTEAEAETVKEEKLKEKDILESFLPKQMTEEELKQHFNVVQPANLGSWMKFLKEHFLNQYDAKVAKAIFEAK